MSKLTKSKKIWFDLFFSIGWHGTNDVTQRIFGSFSITVPCDIDVNYDYIIKHVFANREDFIKGEISNLKIVTDNISGWQRIEYGTKDAKVSVSIMNIH